jgi:flotillin
MTEIIIVVAVFVVFVTFNDFSRYKRCPSDKILVIYGRTGGTSAKCIHGGGALSGLLFKIINI